MLVQHEASFTRKSQPSAASSYQSGFCSQGIKRPAYTPPAFDGLYFWGCIQVFCADFWWIVKLEWYYQIYIIHCAFFGVLRTYYRHRRFASCLFSMKRVSPAKASLRLQAAISLAFAPKVSKGRRTRRRLLMDYTFWGCTQVSFADFWWIIKLGWYD